MQDSRKPPAEVFLNIPYDKLFESLCLAYVSGICALGLVPRATLEIREGTRRLDRILELIKDCRYSIHDLSRVELDRKRPPTPRFNMPFELGLSVARERFSSKKHTWFVYEARDRRLAKSPSDLNGTDPYVHGGTIRGVFRELCNAFVRTHRQPTIQQMREIYKDIVRSLPVILEEAGSSSIYNARVFKDLCVVASASASKNVPNTDGKKRIKF